MRALFVLSLALAAPTASAEVPSSSTAPFQVLDNIEGDHVDLMLTPFRPMALTPDQLTLFALNVHGSRVLRFDDLSGQPADRDSLNDCSRMSVHLLARLLVVSCQQSVIQFQPAKLTASR